MAYYFPHGNYHFQLGLNILLDSLRARLTRAEIFWRHDVTLRSRCFSAPGKGDFLVDETWTIEVGGQNKDHCQIAGIDNAYIAADDIETGQDQRVPLWLFGFLA